jgi:hypothetical protein
MGAVGMSRLTDFSFKDSLPWRIVADHLNIAVMDAAPLDMSAIL